MIDNDRPTIYFNPYLKPQAKTKFGKPVLQRGKFNRAIFFFYSLGLWLANFKLNNNPNTNE